MTYWTTNEGREAHHKEKVTVRFAIALMDINRSKLVGLAIALAYFSLGITRNGWDTKGVLGLSLTLSLPLALIWFPDEISETLGPFRWGGQSDRESPPVLLSAMGWLWLLLVLPLIAYFLP